MKITKYSLLILGFVFSVAFLIAARAEDEDPMGNVCHDVMSTVNPAADDLPAQISKLLNAELEKEFGPLNNQIIYDKTEIWGRVIGIDFELLEGTRLDDTWGNKVVEALGRLGIAATNEGDAVRADGQEIAGTVASSMQFTTARGLDDPDVIGFTAMFPGNS